MTLFFFSSLRVPGVQVRKRSRLSNLRSRVCSIPPDLLLNRSPSFPDPHLGFGFLCGRSNLNAAPSKKPRVE